LGLAYPFNACNPSCTTPVFEDISEQRNIPNIVSMCLTPSNGGVLDLGFIDDSKYTGDLQWVPIRSKHWYNIALIDILVHNYSVNFQEFMFVTTNDVIGTFVDSGTSIVIVSPYSFASIQTLFQTYYGNLPGVAGSSGFFPVGGINPCISKQQMGGLEKYFPEINFVVLGENSQNVTLTIYYNQYLMDLGDQFCLGIASSPSVGAVLGDVFMEGYYVVFDRDNDRLGFGTIANCS